MATTIAVIQMMTPTHPQTFFAMDQLSPHSDMNYAPPCYGFIDWGTLWMPTEPYDAVHLLPHISSSHRVGFDDISSSSWHWCCMDNLDTVTSLDEIIH